MGKLILADDIYEPTRQERNDYRKLVQAVKKINKPAALYLKNAAPNLPHFEYDGDLRRAFTWSYSPAGLEFWCPVYRQLIDTPYYYRRQMDGKIEHVVAP